MDNATAAVPGWAGSLEEFTEFVESRLGGRVRDLRFEISPDRRSVVLLGWTNTYYVKQLAQQIATEIVGDEVELANEIVVC